VHGAHTILDAVGYVTAAGQQTDGGATLVHTLALVGEKILVGRLDQIPGGRKVSATVGACATTCLPSAVRRG
jgi:hypothetical protein